MQTIDQNQSPEKSKVKAKVRAIGNSLGIILPKKILANAGIKKGDTIEINIDLDDLARTQRMKKILAVRGCMKHLRGNKPWNYDTDDIDEADKTEYEGMFD